MGMYLASSLERLRDQKIGQKSMTIIYMAHPSMERGEDDNMNDKNAVQRSSKKNQERIK